MFERERERVCMCVRARARVCVCMLRILYSIRHHHEASIPFNFSGFEILNIVELLTIEQTTFRTESLYKNY